MLCVLIGGLRHLNRRRSFIYMDIATATEIRMIKCMTLKEPTRCYGIRIPNQLTFLQVVNCGFFGLILLKSGRWVATHLLTNKKELGTRFWIIWPWEIAAWRSLLNNPECKIKPLIIHTHECCYLGSTGQTPALPQRAEATTFV